MDITRLAESEEYRRQREELRVAELDLIDHVERVAALRRKLPAGTEADGTQTEWISVFTRGGDGTVCHVYSKLVV